MRALACADLFRAERCGLLLFFVAISPLFCVVFAIAAVMVGSLRFRMRLLE